MFHTEGHSSQLTSVPAYCTRFSHPFFLSFQAENFKSGERYEEARMGREEIGQLGFLPSSCSLESVFVSPPPELFLPLPDAPELSSRGGGEEESRWLEPPPATARQSQLSLTQRGENGSFLPNPFRTPLQVQMRLAVALRCSGGYWGTWAGLRPSSPGLPAASPLLLGGVHRLPVAKGGRKASTQGWAKQRCCWNQA